MVGVEGGVDIYRPGYLGGGNTEEGEHNVLNSAVLLVGLDEDATNDFETSFLRQLGKDTFYVIRAMFDVPQRVVLDERGIPIENIKEVIATHTREDGRYPIRENEVSVATGLGFIGRLIAWGDRIAVISCNTVGSPGYLEVTTRVIKSVTRTLRRSADKFARESGISMESMPQAVAEKLLLAAEPAKVEERLKKVIKQQPVRSNTPRAILREVLDRDQQDPRMRLVGDVLKRATLNRIQDPRIIGRSEPVRRDFVNRLPDGRLDPDDQVGWKLWALIASIPEDGLRFGEHYTIIDNLTAIHNQLEDEARENPNMESILALGTSVTAWWILLMKQRYIESPLNYNDAERVKAGLAPLEETEKIAALSVLQPIVQEVIWRIKATRPEKKYDPQIEQFYGGREDLQNEEKCYQTFATMLKLIHLSGNTRVLLACTEIPILWSEFAENEALRTKYKIDFELPEIIDPAPAAANEVVKAYSSTAELVVIQQQQVAMTLKHTQTNAAPV